MREIEQLSVELHALRGDFLSYRQWAYGLATTLTEMGAHVPPAPPPHRENP